TIRPPGSLGQTPLEALQAVEGITDSFGSLSFPELSIDQAVPLAQYVAALNVKYMLLVAVDETNAEAWYAALRSFPSTGLILSGIASQYKEAIPAAI
ncbi:DUF3383 family protein, partial [Pandoraea sputorum]|uniref:DUF3383 family protein n=1 Tax=Pandoraea sputorum TaxID=93222 RepID=UPI003555DF80